MRPEQRRDLEERFIWNFNVLTTDIFDGAGQNMAALAFIQDGIRSAPQFGAEHASPRFKYKHSDDLDGGLKP